MINKRICQVLFIFIFILEVAAGYYACHIQGFVFGDGISRVASAFYVLYIHPPHLAAIGTTWNPLPSLLELPLMLLWPVYKPIVSSGLAGVVMTAAFAAGSGVIIYKYAVDFGRSRFTGIVLALFYCFNPFMFIYGFSGKAEVPFCFMLLWLTFNYTKWLDNDEPANVIKMAFALALAFLIRYEIFAVVPVMAVSFMIIILTSHRAKLDDERRGSLRYSLERVEGNEVLLLTPFVYALILWMLYDWIITGNPLYFMNSTYSNLGFTRSYAMNGTLSSMVGNPEKILKYVFLCTKFFIFPLLVIVLYRILKLKLFKWDLCTLIMLVLSIILMQSAMLYKGASAGALRYFIYPLPFIVAWFPYEMKKVNSKLFTVLCIVFLIIADAGLGYAWFEEHAFANVQEEVTDFRFKRDPVEETQRQIARYINAKLPKARILMDSCRTYNIILTVNRPQNLVVSCSYQFEKAVRNPRLYKIDYLIIPSYSNDLNLQDAINRQYPKLYKEGASWCSLEREFNTYYKLYRVNKSKAHSRRLIAEPVSPGAMKVLSSKPATGTAKGAFSRSVVKLTSQLQDTLNSIISSITSKTGFKHKTVKTAPIPALPRNDRKVKNANPVLSKTDSGVRSARQAGANTKNEQLQSWYKVWVGPFSDRSKAVAVSHKLVTLDCPIYIPENYPYYIQVGAFADYKNAKQLKRKLMKHGFKVVIMED